MFDNLKEGTQLMSIYIAFISPSQLISPINGYTCRRITKQNVKQFGFDSIEELHRQFPEFPLMCEDYNTKIKIGMKNSIKLSESKNKVNKINLDIKEQEKLNYYKSACLCPKCGSEKSYEKRNNKFCSRKCANSRGPRTEEFKRIISYRSSIRHPHIKKIEKNCPTCKKNYETKNNNQKFCSRKCSRDNNLQKMRAEGLSDYTRNKISKTRKKMFLEGTLDVTGGNTRWIEYKNIRVQGTYELRMCKLLDKFQEKNKIKSWYYTNDRIEYKNIDGKMSTYLLDFKIVRNDGSYFYIETKGYIKDNDICKWKECEKIGMELYVFLNSDITSLEEGNDHAAFY
jgi:endogenous inhibitor of DNA gyrase (YacG/DUF329 family)